MVASAFGLALLLGLCAPVQAAFKVAYHPCDSGEGVMKISKLGVDMKPGGVNLDMLASADEDISDGTFVATVKMQGLELIKQEGNICDVPGDVFKCPIKKGDIKLSHLLKIPNGMSLDMIPAGKYDVHFEAKDAQTKNLLCANLKVDVEESAVESDGKASTAVDMHKEQPPKPPPPQVEPSPAPQAQPKEEQMQPMQEEQPNPGKQAYGDGIRDGFLKGQKDGFVEGFAAGYKSGFKDGNNSTMAKDLEDKVKPQLSHTNLAALSDPVANTAFSFAALSGQSNENQWVTPGFKDKKRVTALTPALSGLL